MFPFPALPQLVFIESFWFLERAFKIEIFSNLKNAQPLLYNSLSFISLFFSNLSSFKSYLFFADEKQSFVLSYNDFLEFYYFQ